MNEFKPLIREVKTNNDIIICAEIMTGSEPWTTLGISKKAMIKTLHNPLLEVYAVYIKNEIIGTFVLQTKGAFTAYIKSIAVKSNWRGKKLGEFMMNYIEKYSFKEGKNVFLCVSSFNTNAQRFYKRKGYQEVGILTNYIVEGYDEILMRKTIGPILEQ